MENEIFYPYAEKMLSEIKDQYIIENEREGKIATKASAFITVIVAIITVYIPLIPFENFKNFFSSITITELYKKTAIMFLIILSVGLIFLLVAFTLFVKAYKVKEYKRFAVDDLLTISLNRGERNEVYESQIAQSMVAHYHQILRGTIDEGGNIKIDTENAEAVACGIKWTVAGFIILSIATIALRIIIVV